jgi:hypothetical protein
MPEPARDPLMYPVQFRRNDIGRHAPVIPPMIMKVPLQY